LNLLFDLDGTLTDPKEGIVKCIEYALDKLDSSPPKDSLIPLVEAFSKNRNLGCRTLNEKDGGLIVRDARSEAYFGRYHPSVFYSKYNFHRY